MLVLSAPLSLPATPASAQERYSEVNLSRYESFKKRFITPRGRVVDTGNNYISHSEGQGYAMLFAVAFNDRDTFDKLWKWTREQLQTRPEDKLLSWRWTPTPYGGFVDDKNNATDGDILVAWALLHADRRWQAPGLREAAQAILNDIERYLIAEQRILSSGSMTRLALLPGCEGFVSSEGVTLNLSYYVFPALADFAKADKRPQSQSPWNRLIEDGLSLVSLSRFGAYSLPSNWILINNDRLPSPAPQYPAIFGYDAARIPLYAVWYQSKTPSISSIVSYWGSPDYRANLLAEAVLFPQGLHQTKPEQDRTQSQDASDRPSGATAAGRKQPITHPASRGLVSLINTVGRIQAGRNWEPLRTPPSSAAEDYYSACLDLLARLAEATALERGYSTSGLYEN